MNEIRVPFGLCEITYGDMKLPAMADEGVFTAIPTYVELRGGAFNSVENYMLESYDVKFSVSVSDESYEALKLHMPTLQTHECGLFDNPSKVSMDGKRLVIHPVGIDSRAYDICIWNAYISPENGFQRTYKKETDSFVVTFIGKRTDTLALNNSFFFIGDWEKVGVV